MDAVARGAKKAAAAEDRAWDKFQQQFPNADRSKFAANVEFDKNHTASAEIFFKQSSGVSTSVSGSDRRYWSQDMKAALGVAEVEGFPYQLIAEKIKIALPIPPINFTEPAPPKMKNLFSGDFKIYATPDQAFVTQFREIFKETRLKHTNKTESKAWLAAPKMEYWPQQLNFAVFCATQARGVSREIFDNEVSLPPQIRAFYRCHVYFTERRILFQLGGIQSISALPGDPTFNQFDNPYDKSTYERICREFGIAPSSDFRFTGGDNRGLGVIYLHAYEMKGGEAKWDLIGREK